MRYAQSRVMLLDFDRNTQELYDGKHTELTSKGINLGVVAKDVQYQSNKVRILWHLFRKESCGVITAVPIRQHRFSVSGVAIWMSGRTCRNMELRSSGWKIGDIDFVVYGYMNRDVHEGEVGIAVYHYGAELNQVEEELFIPMKSSYEYLKEDMELLSYVTRDDMLYVILEDDLYQIDIKQKSFQIVKEN